MGRVGQLHSTRPAPHADASTALHASGPFAGHSQRGIYAMERSRLAGRAEAGRSQQQDVLYLQRRAFRRSRVISNVSGCSVC